ncbi:CBS domain-containing protein [Aeromonas schubertii]|nr:CBS domain-containing protein [Aeromonas schubertii]KUE79198.1 hypothetical protein ATO46_06425 [Aeromonas schubertii]MBZ6072141.1 CBS domain-containing protein [Aeromonas schubertii]QCG48318.1 CBS domain-containing protein [Aeromonas schubertii]
MHSLKVKDYMLVRPVTLSPDTTIPAAVEKFLHSNQMGGPVVDKQGHLLGWISEQDCIATMIKETYHCERVALVGDVMRKEVLSVGPESSVLELASMMTEHKPKMYPVLEDGRLVGVINRHLVLKAINEQLQDCFINHPA